MIYVIVELLFCILIFSIIVCIFCRMCEEEGMDEDDIY